MMIIRGVNLYPSQIEQIMLTADGVGPHYRLILERPGPMDELTLECEPAPGGGDRGALQAQLERMLKEGTGVRIAVSVLDPGSVPRSEGKAVRVVDRR
jgi:phenylacetate-CoA ligase